jgi:hypothetical protein
MKKSKLIIHCSDSPYPQHGVDEIRRWHIERGWTDIGYHFVIERSGELKKGRLTYPGAHTLGHNNQTGLCLCGLSGQFENEQMKTLERFVLDNNFLITEIKQHSDYDLKKPNCAGLTDSQINYLNSLL